MLYFLAENNCDINYISTNVITNIINILSLLGEDEIIQKLSTDYNLRFDDNHKYSPIYVACSRNNFSTMSLLFKHGAKVCIHTKELIKKKLTKEIPENCERFKKFLKETNTSLEGADEYQELVSFLDEIFVGEGDVTFFDNDESFIELFESNFDVIERSRPTKRRKN